MSESTVRDRLLVALWYLNTKPHCFGDIIWPRYARIAEHAGVSVAVARREFQAMRTEGLFVFMPAVDCECRPCGSGYFPTLKGEKLIEELTRDAEPSDEAFT